MQHGNLFVAVVHTGIFVTIPSEDTSYNIKNQADEKISENAGE